MEETNMSKTAFSPANILLPRECGLTKWAVVACDQYTSQPEYWERVDKYVGDAPSTLRLILPESKLESDNVDQEIQKINHTMEQYLADGRLQELEDAMLLLESASCPTARPAWACWASWTWSSTAMRRAPAPPSAPPRAPCSPASRPA